MPLEREMLPDRPEAREKFLCALRVAKTAHAPLAFARRLVAVLGPVVQAGCSFDEHVLHVRKLWDLGFRRGIAAQLIGDDLARYRVRSQHMFEEAFGGRLVAPLLHQDVALYAMLVHRTPQQIRYATKRDKHLIQVPRVSWLGPRGFYPTSKAFAKLVAPAPDCLVCHDDPALEEQFFDVSQTQLEAEIPTHRATDDRGRETMTVIERL